MSFKLKPIKVTAKICKRCENKVHSIVKAKGKIIQRARCTTCDSPSWTLSPKGKFILLKTYIVEQFKNKTKNVLDKIIMNPNLCHNCNEEYFQILNRNGTITIRKKCPFCNIRLSKGVKK